MSKFFIKGKFLLCSLFISRICTKWIICLYNVGKYIVVYFSSDEHVCQDIGGESFFHMTDGPDDPQ